MDLYVYYDVPLARRDVVRARVRAMQADLASAAGRCRLLRREPAAVDAETWMEIYEDVSPAFEAGLTEAVARHALADLTGDRHVERFVDHPCA